MSVISDGPIAGSGGANTAAPNFSSASPPGADPARPAPLANFAPPLARDMPGPEKAAILMITLGLDLSSKLFKL